MHSLSIINCQLSIIHYHTRMNKLSSRLGAWIYLFLGIALFAIGLLSLDYIINSWWPFDVLRLDLVRATALDNADAPLILDAADTTIIIAFLAGVMITATGLALPLAYVLNKRFGLTPTVSGDPTNRVQFYTVMRQAMFFSIWFTFCTWLQMNRALGMAVAVLIGIVLVLFEVLLQIRTRASEVTNNE